MIQAPALFGLLLTLAYLIGAIPFSVIISRFKGVDLATIGSGNFGATNVYRALGLGYAVAVFLLDALKGSAMVYLAVQAFASPIIHVIIGFTVIFGHTFSLYLGFKGGKGVATTAGVFMVLTPIPLLITIGIVAVVIAISKTVSMGTLIGCICLPVMMHLFNTSPIIFYSVLPLSLFIILKHIPNIRRLLKGTEHRIR